MKVVNNFNVKYQLGIYIFFYHPMVELICEPRT